MHTQVFVALHHLHLFSSDVNNVQVSPSVCIYICMYLYIHMCNKPHRDFYIRVIWLLTLSLVKLKSSVTLTNKHPLESYLEISLCRFNTWIHSNCPHLCVCLCARSLECGFPLVVPTLPWRAMRELPRLSRGVWD